MVQHVWGRPFPEVPQVFRLCGPVRRRSNKKSKGYVMHDVDFDGKILVFMVPWTDDLRFSDFCVLPVGEELPVMHINLVTNK